MSLYDNMALGAEWRARVGPATPKQDDTNAVMQSPEETRKLIGDLARGLGVYARRPMSEHEYRLELEAVIRRQAARRCP